MRPKIYKALRCIAISNLAHERSERIAFQVFKQNNYPIETILKDGFKGYNQMNDDELVKEYWLAFKHELTDKGYSSFELKDPSPLIPKPDWMQND